jgi:hypothetical protein
VSGGFPRFGCLHIGRVWHAAAGDNIGTTEARPYAITSPDNNHIRFEVRSGDVLEYSGIGYSDPSTSERCELGGDSGSSDGQLPFNTDIHYEAQVYIASGFDLASNWSVITQFHASTGGSPIVDIGFRQGNGLNRLIMMRRTGTAGSASEFPIDVMGTTFPRDRWVHIIIRLRANTSGAGYIRCWVDGVQRVNFSGTVGYNTQTWTYCRFGIYRQATSTTWVVNFRNMELKSGTVNDSAVIPPSIGGETGLGSVTVISGGSTVTTPIFVDVTGVEATGSVGDVTALIDVTHIAVDLLEVAGEFALTLSVGDVTVTDQQTTLAPVEGVAANTAVGVIDPDTVRTVTIEVTGVGAAGDVGSGVVGLETQALIDVTGVEAFCLLNKSLVWDTALPSTSSSWVEIVP